MKANSFASRARDIWRGDKNSQFRQLVRDGRVTYGQASYGVPQVIDHIYNRSSLQVGNYTSISPEATFLLGGEHPVDRITTFPHRIALGLDGAGLDGFPLASRDTIVGSDVWIGARALILSGRSIGDGAIVAAGAVVVRDVEPFAIVGGSPARLIRHRFNAAQREALLRVRWWDWSTSEVIAAVPLLTSANIDEFLRHASE